MHNENENIPDWFKCGDNEISLYSSVRIVRNFKYLNFSSSGDHNSFKQVEKKVDTVLEAMIEQGAVIKYDISIMDQSEIIRLQKFRILPARRNDALAKMKLYHHKMHKTYLLINYADHLTFFSHTGGKDIQEAFKNCSAFTDIFADQEMSMDEKGNYLTSSLDYFGTGLKCFSVLTIPAVRLFGDLPGLLSSLKSNRIAVKPYFSLDGYDMTIISNTDSISKNPDGIITDFIKILDEIGKLSNGLIKENSGKTADLRLRCSRIINYDFLTFRNFMEIYYILSFIGLNGQSVIAVDELNGQLGFLIFESSRTSFGGGLKRSVTDSMIEKINKTLNKG
jgi:protein-arginine kinase